MTQKATIKKARELRRDQPDAERLFWSRVRNRQLGNWKFRRQVPIGPYIVDFYVDEVKAIVELDGDQHGRENHPQRDKNCDKWLKENGYFVMRFWNNEVYDNLSEVLTAIVFQMNELHDQKTE